MANFTDQVFEAWNQFEEETGRYVTNPDDFITWGMNNGKLAPKPEDVRNS